MKWIFVLAGLLATLAPAQAQGPDDQYVQIYNEIQQADSLSSSGQPREALAAYVEAQKALQRFQKGYPDWNAGVINFRLGYVAEKISALSANIPTTATPATASTPPAKPAPAEPAEPVKSAAQVDLENQLGAAKEQLGQLRDEKASLQAKLKEALAVRPASTDPRELAKAEEKIKSLLKEIDLLKVSLEKRNSKVPAAVELKGSEPAKQALAEANRLLAEETRKANGLALEKKTLQEQLDRLASSNSKASSDDSIKSSLDEANRRLAEQSKLVSSLTQEKDMLQARLKSLGAEAEVAAALRAENQRLKQELADLKVPITAGKSVKPMAQPTPARQQVAAKPSSQELLRQEQVALEGRMKELSGPDGGAGRAKAKAERGRSRQSER